MTRRLQTPSEIADFEYKIGRGPGFETRQGRVTAGTLARELHLTTGAITGLIDRLERAGFARRSADPTDRRRVIVTATAKKRRVGELYGPLATALRRAVEGYSERDLATDFIRRLRAAVANTAEGIRGNVT